MTTVLGTRTKAKKGFGAFDLSEPPTLKGTVSAYFDHHDWENPPISPPLQKGGKGGLYNTDYQPVLKVGETQTWQLVVYSNQPDAKMQLSWEKALEQVPADIMLSFRRVTTTNLENNELENPKSEVNDWQDMRQIRSVALDTQRFITKEMFEIRAERFEMKPLEGLEVIAGEKQVTIKWAANDNPFITTPGAIGVQVPVNVTSVAGVSVISANLIVSYDTNVLSATGATLEGTIAQGGGVQTNIDDAKGEISLGIMSAQPLSGSGVIVFIMFDVDSDDKTDRSALTFKKALLNSGEVLTASSDGDISLPVTLSSFVAVYDAEKDMVFLEWQLENEYGNLGFAIYRSEQKNGHYTKIGWVTSKGDTQTTRSYQFVDETAEEGKPYFYMLEYIDITGRAEHSNVIQLDWADKYKLTTGNLSGQPSTFCLYQNYPNPFNPETWLPYQLASDTSVTIHIYNTKGQLVRLLNLGNQAAGIYVTRDRAAYWDGRNITGEVVSSGIYFYQLTAGDFSEKPISFRAIRKMVIIK